VAEPLGLPADIVAAALTRLQDDGHILSGRFDPDRPDQTLWCDRRVLSRIDRLTRNRLRAEVEPVSLRDFYRFLLRWHGLTDATRRRGRAGLAQVLEQLDGSEAPAGLWEPDILAARIDSYDTDDLDALCLNGQFGWGRAGPAQDRPKLTRATPIALFATDNADLWRSIAPQATPELSPRADRVLAAFTARGASFAAQVERDARMLRADFEDGLAELVAAGRMTADSFAGLRALLANPTKLRVSRLELIANTNAGRWSLLPTPDPLTDPVAHEAAVERYARALLRRYGVVVRIIVAREATRIRWLDLLRVLRLMEARGEVRGGYFVSGAGGEHFALPEAIPFLREVRADERRGETAVVAACDPLNLTGTLGGHARVPANPDTRILVSDGLPVALRKGAVVKPFAGLPKDEVALPSWPERLVPRALGIWT
jgi:ATP-dependent Lhr-like helicase